MVDLSVRTLPAVLAVAIGLGSCGGSTPDQAVPSERDPDAAGVVESVTHESIRLGDGRTFVLSERLASFSTYTGKATPVLSWNGYYVHLGLDGKTVRWVAGVGQVLAGEPPVVLYNGTLVKASDNRGVFRDGTVLALSPRTERGPTSGPVRAVIDPRRHVVTSIERQ